MNSNKLIVAAAGSGKTTFLVKEALKITDQNVLITTFTNANEAEIKKSIIEINEHKCIPKNVTVQTWFSMLLQHGVKPYQNCLFRPNIKGINLLGGRSPHFIPKKKVVKYYFDNRVKFYSDKISEFVMECNKASNGRVINRLSRIYPHIFIDEIQDLSGYDLDFLRMLFDSSINTLLVGDPRQGVYSTNNAAKNKKYSRSGIVAFFKAISNIVIDEESLTVNHRSIQAVCNLSNNLFPNYPRTESGNERSTGHDGIFLVKPKDVACYLDEYAPIQLRDSKRKEIDLNYEFMNFGQSKGRSFDRVLIYPTTPIVKWLKGADIDLKPISRSKLYVAITRARHSVAFVYNYKPNENIEGCTKYIAPQQ